MDQQTVSEVIDCLPHDRTLFNYYRDRYGVGLLRKAARKNAGRPLRVAELKQSVLAPLMHKPRVKEVLSRLGTDRLTEEGLALLDHDPQQLPFVLTLGTWGSDHSTYWRRKQITRRGYNLVLQLNFSRLHDLELERLHEAPGLFNYRGHPVSPQRNTLAWARMDIDLLSGTALIEEIQSDWIRKANTLKLRAESRIARGAKPQEETVIWGMKCPLGESLAYCEKVLDQYRVLWSEAMLWAVIHFLHTEIGIDRIFYHTEQSGKLLKRMGDYLPPQSLYTDLPRRFCFAETSEIPEFLVREKAVYSVLRRNPGVHFFRLAA